jgi:hypothetical protein
MKRLFITLIMVLTLLAFCAVPISACGPFNKVHRGHGITWIWYHGFQWILSIGGHGLGQLPD